MPPHEQVLPPGGHSAKQDGGCIFIEVCVLLLEVISLKWGKERERGR